MKKQLYLEWLDECHEGTYEDYEKWSFSIYEDRFVYTGTYDDVNAIIDISMNIVNEIKKIHDSGITGESLVKAIGV